jgi:selenocysteine insertion sequence-binding protein 2
MSTENESETPAETAKENKNEQKKKTNEMIIRDYVNQIINPELDEVIKEMLTKLKKFQSRLYKTKPKKFKANRRFVIGLRETQRAINAKKLIAVILAPNIEPGSLDSVISQIIVSARMNNIPVIYALSKRKIAKIFNKSVNMSVIGLYSANGAYEEYKKMLELAKRGRELFEKQQKEQNHANNPQEEEKCSTSNTPLEA